MKESTRGVFAHWNYQGSLPFFDVDFGAGRPTRGVPWNLAEPSKVVPTPDGGLELFVTRHGYGLPSWMSWSGLATWAERERRWRWVMWWGFIALCVCYFLDPLHVEAAWLLTLLSGLALALGWWMSRTQHYFQRFVRESAALRSALMSPSNDSQPLSPAKGGASGTSGG